MTAHHFTCWRKLVLCVLVLSGATGCTDDLASISRDHLALESESVDRMMKVVDEDSAKEYMAFLTFRYVPRLDVIGKRKEKWVLNLDAKKDGPAFMEFEMAQTKLMIDMNKTVASMPVKKLAKDLKDVQSEHFPNSEDYAKVYLPHLFANVTAERLALLIAKGREFNRLKNVREELARKDSTADLPSLDQIINYINPVPPPPP